MDSVFRIVSHDCDEFRRERERLFIEVRNVTPVGLLLEVGSTAVPGLIGKEDIDFALIVPADQFVVARADLDKSFQRDGQQLSNFQYQGYVLPSKFDAAVQLTIRGSKFDTFQNFVSKMRRSPSLRRAYNKLKLEWDGKPMDEYRVAKRKFIEDVL
ncbi:GrpB-like predicted nucleotidyltransferase (UPF0157 family) [Rhizobium esperanzae]|uniref:GrpB-like predicted nucleotidyltransferase (UPF0157 family) n=1 Tax=Rhizobium esperanzae TaxID=1967781 RepID=A0A7W6R3Y4_9HYPH|nr:GrpB-like predicted nucleotidyltransferase (UPF0157 family) [Rhizobium esperanzae]